MTAADLITTKETCEILGLKYNTYDSTKIKSICDLGLLSPISSLSGKPYKYFKKHVDQVFQWVIEGKLDISTKEPTIIDETILSFKHINAA